MCHIATLMYDRGLGLGLETCGLGLGVGKGLVYITDMDTEFTHVTASYLHLAALAQTTYTDLQLHFGFHACKQHE